MADSDLSSGQLSFDKDAVASTSQSSQNTRKYRSNSASMIGKTEAVGKDKTPTCGKCCSKFSDKSSTTSIECERCFKWYHVKCTRLTQNDFKTLQKTDIGVHWYCEKCDSVFVAIENRLKALQEMLEELRNNNNETVEAKTYAEITAKLDNNIRQTQVNHIQVSKQIQNLKVNLEVDNRAKNLVVFGIKEDEKSAFEAVIDMLKNCSVYGPNIVQPQVMRLGKKAENKSRPIKICFNSEAEKWETLKRINHVKPNGIFARLDLDKEQQQKDFQLRMELKKRREQDKEHSYKIVKNQIVMIN